MERGRGGGRGRERERRASGEERDDTSSRRSIAESNCGRFELSSERVMSS